MSLCEWMAAFEGYCEAEGIDVGAEPATASDLEELEEKLRSE